ncbi:hypothetical protein [Mycobacterium haemophilum]|uniref:Uncharacterized protein n=1 Tax=Mycobacterium haemophilum TaxID=29311 RepID=A0A0I9Y5X4_9MYCO|nr:hypothetical protein [Mycobacterium haemophilum]KLO27360.1 hypothetical protein ABH39_15980 [Mycobacterium haemophilum]KLO35057.1 hypothetical protein ABH38_17145 [Mycobacterium haemophilum]KLO40002.1 hypothetical protein ABH37_17255 [Mycobacterium haemophilum]KLO47332.1 hypothetical protein ABH36_17075 [Mycobacterium haemophilum]
MIPSIEVFGRQPDEPLGYLARAVPQPIKGGDEIRIGDVALTFRSHRFTAVAIMSRGPTVTRISQAAMVIGGRRHRELLDDL